MTDDDRAAMVAAQGGVRALCGPCNMGLGLFKDEPRRLEAAIDYLHRATVAAAITEYDDHTCCVIELNSRRLHAA